MLAIERREKILQLINQKKIVRTSELKDTLNVTEVTLRNDLEYLENLGELVRIYGGATLPQNFSDFSQNVDERENINIESKKIIGIAASKMVNSGDTIFLDGSTSSLYVARNISDLDDLTVITNAEKVVAELSTRKNVKIICVGGILRKKNLSYVSSVAEETIEKYFYASKMFFSCYGISMKIGLTDSNEDESNVKKAMMKKSNNLIFLCDSMKFERVGYPILTSIDKVDQIVTDKKLSHKWENVFIQNNVNILIAEKE